MNDLPNEVLLMLFPHFNARELTVLQRVCRNWRKLIHPDKILWRNVEYESQPYSYLDDVVDEINFFRLRGGGKLYNISVSICIDQEVENIMSFCQVLLETSVRSLKIKFWSRGIKSDWRDSSRKFDKCVDFIFKAVMSCTDLERLHIQGGEHLDQPTINCFPSSELPILKCRLREFMIYDFDVSYLFSPGSATFQVLSNVHIINVHRCCGLNYLKLINVLENAKETLQEFYYTRKSPVYDGQPRNLAITQVLSLPRLVHLHWNTQQDLDGRRLHCPNLRHLSIASNAMETLFDGSHYDSVEKITLLDPCGAQVPLEKVEELQRYTRLRHLGLPLSNPNSFMLVNFCIERTSVEEWCFCSEKMEEFECNIIDMVNRCKQDPSMKTVKLLHPIDSSRVIQLSSKPALSDGAFQWLDRKLEYFKYKDNHGRTLKI